MLFINSYSYIGYKHKKVRKCCQDYSLSFKDNERAIIAVADGHGGDIYVRSQYGSKFACLSILDILKLVCVADIKKVNMEDIERTIKLNILSRWNNYVEDHFNLHQFSEKENNKLNDEQLKELNNNYSKAYGSTLCGAMIIDNKYWLFISLGDTEVFGIKDGDMSTIFDNSDEPCGNITHSLCEEDAFNYIKLKICRADEYDTVIICSDGLTSPFTDYDNFYKNFVKNVCDYIDKNKSDYIAQDVVELLSREAGNGDDVSFAILKKL